MWKHGDGGSDDATAQAGQKEQGVFQQDQPTEGCPAEADGAQEGQFAAPFQDRKSVG